MNNRYEQVVLTYLRQWQFWLYLAAWMTLVFLVGNVLPLLDRLLANPVLSQLDRPLVFVFIALAATAPAAVIGHAKQQLADARATLTPTFRAPHVIVAIAFSVGAIVAMPLLSYRAFDMPSALGLTATVALASAGFASIAYFQSLASVILPLAGASLIMLPLVRELAVLMLMSFHPVYGEAVGVIVIAFAWAILGWIFYRLAMVREDVPEYGRILGHRASWSYGGAPAQSRVDAPSLIARLQLAAADRRLRAIRNVFDGHIARRVLHWKRSAEMSGTKGFAAGLTAAFLTALPLLTGEADEPQRGNGHAIVAIAAVISVLIPIFCVTVTWLPRRRSMGYELTRPASREQFIREFGLAIAADLAEWWLWLTVAASVPVLVWGPPLNGIDVLAMLALSAAEQALAFGIFVSILRVRSPGASDGSILMSVVAVVIPIMGTTSIPRTPGLTLAIGLVVAALGAALTYDAYRRWCETDLA